MNPSIYSIVADWKRNICLKLKQPLSPDFSKEQIDCFYRLVQSRIPGNILMNTSSTVSILIVGLLIKHFSPCSRHILLWQSTEDVFNHLSLFNLDLQIYNYQPPHHYQYIVTYDESSEVLKPFLPHVHPLGAVMQNNMISSPELSVNPSIPTNELDQFQHFIEHILKQNIYPELSPNDQFQFMHIINHYLDASTDHICFYHFSLNQSESFKFLHQLLYYLFPTKTITGIFVDIYISEEVKEYANQFSNLHVLQCNHEQVLTSFFDHHSNLIYPEPNFIYFDQDNSIESLTFLISTFSSIFQKNTLCMINHYINESFYESHASFLSKIYKHHYFKKPVPETSLFIASILDFFNLLSPQLLYPKSSIYHGMGYRHLAQSNHVACIVPKT